MAKLKTMTLATQTMFAELTQRAMDAEFDDTYDERGSFVKTRVKRFQYWYYKKDEAGTKKQIYVGPVRDKAITSRIKKFDEIKSDFRQRREMVRALTTAGLPQPDSIAGLIIEALWKAGFFRLRGVLIGTNAFQTFAGMLGVRFESMALRTADVDAAQFYDVSRKVGDSMPPILDVLRTVDPSFHPITDITDDVRSARYQTDGKYKVEFLTPNRGSDENQSRPAEMPALGGAAAQPLRHMDFLIYEPERSVVLFKGGIPVVVPAPQRYAVHKIIVAVERRGDPAKADKDIHQAGALIQALSVKRPLELAEAWSEAWHRGPRWRDKLRRGRARLPKETQDLLAAVVADAEKEGLIPPDAESQTGARSSPARRRS
jgi:hypothetical protein